MVVGRDGSALEAGQAFHFACHPVQLLLAVARDEVAGPVGRVRDAEHGWRRQRVHAARHEGRQALLEALVEPRREQLVGGQHVDALEARQPRQQVEVGRPQAAGFGGDVGHARHHVPQRGPRARDERQLADAVLVDAVDGGRAALEGAEGRHEEQRLLEQPGRAAVALRLARQRPDEQALEVVHRAPQAAEGVVEAEHLGEDARAHGEGRRRGGRGLDRRGTQERLAREVVERGRRPCQPRVQEAVEPRARDEQRETDRVARRAGTIEAELGVDGGRHTVGGQ